MYTMFEGQVLGRSTKAVLFQSNYWEQPIWFPTSQSELIEDGETGYVIKVKPWLADKLGVLEFTYYSKEDIHKMVGSS